MNNIFIFRLAEYFFGLEEDGLLAIEKTNLLGGWDKGMKERRLITRQGRDFHYLDLYWLFFRMSRDAMQSADYLVFHNSGMCFNSELIERSVGVEAKPMPINGRPFYKHGEIFTGSFVYNRKVGLILDMNKIRHLSDTD